MGYLRYLIFIHKYKKRLEEELLKFCLLPVDTVEYYRLSSYSRYKKYKDADFIECWMSDTDLDYFKFSTHHWLNWKGGLKDEENCKRFVCEIKALASLRGTEPLTIYNDQKKNIKTTLYSNYLLDKYLGADLSEYPITKLLKFANENYR